MIALVSGHVMLASLEQLLCDCSCGQPLWGNCMACIFYLNVGASDFRDGTVFLYRICRVYFRLGVVIRCHEFLREKSIKSMFLLNAFFFF